MNKQPTSSDTKHIIASGKKYYATTYAQLPIVIKSGSGVRVQDTDGKEYLDFVAGIAVNALGYGNEKLKAALEQVIEGGITHCSNLYWNRPAVEAAEKLVELGSMEKVFFCNSGAEANEAALKLARKYGHQHKDLNTNRIITMEGSFHGRTYAAVTATGQTKYHKNFAPMMPDFAYARFNDFESVAALVDDRTCAILVEPVQGEGGIIPATQQFLTQLRELCDQEDILLIFDEVQCGMGRLGTPFAFEHFGVKPDAVTLAKGLGAGVPVGALLIGSKAAETFQPGEHASTFGGSLLAGAAVSCMMDHLSDDRFMKHLRNAAATLQTGLEALKSQFPHLVIDVRGHGLMMGIELSQAAKPVIEDCLQHGLLLVGAGEKVIRFVPPLIVTPDEIQEGLDILKQALSR
ncbi:MAG: aspartate aminotransferase family protein [Spirochaetota bacterium]